MHFAYNSIVAIIVAANSVYGGKPSHRVGAETSAQLQFTKESAGDFILNHFRSGNPVANKIEFRNIVASGHECLKRFTNGHELGTHNSRPLVPDSGLILSSGNPYEFTSGGGDQSDGSSTNWYSYGDDELTALLQQTNPYAYTMDACKVQVELRCVGSSNQPARLSFNYIFGSEEYYEYDNSPYTDSFAFFLNGENMAKLPDGETRVGITTVNSNVNNEYFIGNDVSDPVGVQYPQIEADGFTTQLTAEGSVNLNEWTTMKIVIADVGDRLIDSWVLVEGGSLSCEAKSESTVSPTKVPTLKPTSKSPTPLPTVQPTTKSPVSLLFLAQLATIVSLLKTFSFFAPNKYTLHVALSSDRSADAYANSSRWVCRVRHSSSFPTPMQ